jgi:pyridoxamine 5'-phosphate oxidase
MINRDFLTHNAHPAVPLLISSTDARTPKTRQLAQSGFVELAWWIDGSGDQFRIAGRARIVPSPELGSGLLPLPPAPTDCPGLAAHDKDGVDWEEKRRAAFDLVSEHMRASWCRPPPGSVLEGGYEEMEKWPTSVKKPSDAVTDEEKALTEEALRNYALVIVEPAEVDWVEMSIVPNRRSLHKRVGETWKEIAIVP